MGGVFCRSDLLYNVVVNLLSEFVVVVLGVLFAHTIRSGWEKWRYGGWSVKVKRGNEPILERSISPTKAKEILQEPAELSVFLKGVVSPYEIIRCDLIEEGSDIGLLKEDKENKVFVIDLEKNPPPSQGGAML